MSSLSANRIDKFLWSVRIYKTRTIASDACKNTRILINEMPVKPSRTIETGDILIVKKMPVIYTYIIKGIPSSRIGAKLVNEYLEDRTPEEETRKLEIKTGINTAYRERGSGRPTKRERRDIDKFTKDGI